MSGISELVKQVLSAVSEETEIPCETILSKCSRAEVVDARWIAVALLRRTGMYTMRIAEQLGISPRYVQYIMTDFSDRMCYNPTLRTNYEKIAKKLGIKNEISTK